MARRLSIRLTEKQKADFAPLLRNTWAAIASDANELVGHGRGRVGVIIELVCDANRPEMYGPMSAEDYKVLMSAYSNRDTQKWLRQVLNY